MLRVNDELKKYDLKPKKYINIKNVTIVDTDKGKYVFKKNGSMDMFMYLDSRNFNYYPKILSNKEDEYIITEYIDDIKIPIEQKIDDMIDLVSLLHNKTTYYKEVSDDEYKQIYEDLNNNIEYLYSYYSDIMTIIESKIYLSPPEFYLAVNVSKIYKSLNYCHKTLENWYSNVKNLTKKRVVVLHNNLSLEHFIKNDMPYLISWDKAKIDMPIFDIYKLYKNSDESFDFKEVLKRYEHNYPLKKEEKQLLYILLAMPLKVEFDDNNLNMCIKLNKMFNLIDRVNTLLPDNFENTKKN